MKMNSVCFTGHREIPADRVEYIEESLLKIIRHLYAEGYRYFHTGGARGFDTLAAKAVLALHAECPLICLRLVLPCKEQAARWSEEDKRVYEEIKMWADDIIYTSEHYTRYCMHERNRRLVDESAVCVCYLQKPTGGTAYTVDYAEKKGLDIIFIT